MKTDKRQFVAYLIASPGFHASADNSAHAMARSSRQARLAVPPSNITRRLRELVNEGKLLVEYRKNQRTTRPRKSQRRSVYEDVKVDGVWVKRLSRPLHLQIGIGRRSADAANKAPWKVRPQDLVRFRSCRQKGNHHSPEQELAKSSSQPPHRAICSTSNCAASSAIYLRCGWGYPALPGKSDGDAPAKVPGFANGLDRHENEMRTCGDFRQAGFGRRVVGNGFRL